MIAWYLKSVYYAIAGVSLQTLLGNLEARGEGTVQYHTWQEDGGGDYPRRHDTTYHTSSGVPGKKLR